MDELREATEILGDTNVIVDEDGYAKRPDWLDIKIEDGELDERSEIIIRFARAVVAIYGAGGKDDD